MSRDKAKPPFLIVAEWIKAGLFLRIPLLAQSVLRILELHAGKDGAYPTADTIAKYLGIKRQKVYRMLKELVTAGVVRTDDDPKRRRLRFGMGDREYLGQVRYWLVELDDAAKRRLQRLPLRKKQGNAARFKVVKDRKRRVPVLILAAVGILLGLGTMGVVWVYAIPRIWHWAVDPLSQPLSWEWLKVIPGALALLFVGSLSIWLPGLPILLAGQVLRISVEASEEQLTRRVDELSLGLSEAEIDLEKADQIGLVPIVRYSRAQLEAYYKIGLTQTQRSFRYSVIAMWLGFLVVLAGLAFQILPLNQLLQGATIEKADIKFAAIAGSAIIEVIAALFLWVYRSSIAQLTYFYNRQLHIHNVIMCYRMASSMKDPDDSVRAIIEKVLERSWSVERPEGPSGKVLGEMFAKGSAQSKG